MNNKMQKIYLYDRWFYYINETDNLLIYNSQPNDLNNGIRLEYNKKNDNLNLLYFKKGKVYGKLNVTKGDKELFCIKNDKIYLNLNTKQTNNIYNISYKSFECEELKKDEDIYVNLLYELNMIIKFSNLSDINIKLSKKRKLNKICYLEPTFELDENINIKKLPIKNDQIEYMLGLFNELRYYLPVIYKQIQKDRKEKNQKNNEVIKELTIPEELTMYDRTYKLVSKNDYNLVYENLSRDKVTLKIELNPYETKIKHATIECIPKNDNEVRDKIEFSHESNGNIIIKYINLNKIRLELNRVGYTAKLSTYAEYDNNGDNIRNEVYIDTPNKEFKLCVHPVFKSKYLDEDGIEYTLGNSDYARFHGFQNFISPIVHNTEKQLYKELK